jgi:DNA-directed RNA polymerase specialized sigma24 family protein
MNVAVATVPWWPRELERQAHDSAAEATIREIEARLHTSAHAYAYKLVGADAEDAVQTAWVRALTTYDPESGPLSSLFLHILRNTCHDIWRRRRDETLPSDDVAALAESAYRAPYPADGGFEEEVLSRLADSEGPITAAIEALDLPAGQRDMLRSLIVSGEADTTDATARKRRQRMRDRIDDLAGLKPAERRAVSLQRQHRALDADTQALVASARLKVLRLFDIQTED